MKTYDRSDENNETYQTFSLGALWKIASVLEIDAYKLLLEPGMREEIGHDEDSSSYIIVKKSKKTTV